ncbi:DNA polymerase IV [Profundicola chukchiensis]|uniref:DNA polymerase IV n=1 Tax=Profundicola chukchiensis TaxID=2961959 RepID=UPI0038B4D6E1
MNQDNRKIIHIDMDAFYASVEQHDAPELKGKPIAVGGSSERGVVAAASYEARKFGVKSAMSSMIAAKRCPDLIFIKPRFERYREVSYQIREIFYEYTDLVEPLSLDEAYLDVTINKKNISSASQIAREIRAKILEKTGLTASAGISVNKFVAKIASDYNKPNGQKTVTQEEILDFLGPLKIQQFYGIGKVTAQKMRDMGIFNGKDLRDLSLEFLEQNFRNMGLHYYQIARGIHNSPVNPNRQPKSVGGENTFETNLKSIQEMQSALVPIIQKVVDRLAKKEVKGRSITLKIKFDDFSVITRSQTGDEYVDQFDEIYKIINELLILENPRKPVRLLGVSISQLNLYAEKTVQLKIPFPALKKGL